MDNNFNSNYTNNYSDSYAKPYNPDANNANTYQNNANTYQNNSNNGANYNYNYNNTAQPVGNGKMREKYTRIWAWMGWPGIIVALTAGNHEEEMTKSHINQAMGLDIVGSAIGLGSCIFAIPYVGWVLAIICILPLLAIAIWFSVIGIMGIVKACQSQPVNFFPFNKFNIIK